MTRLTTAHPVAADHETGHVAGDHGSDDHSTAHAFTPDAYIADDESAAYAGDVGGVATVSAAANVATVADLNALRAAYENLRAAFEDLRTGHGGA